MKKISLLIVILSLVGLLCGCSTNVPPQKETVNIVIPNSYFAYTGVEIDDAVAAYQELGDMYCTEAKVIEDGMLLEVTPEQRDNLIKRNNDYIDELLIGFEEENELYSYVGSDKYDEISFYYDENIGTNTQIIAVFGVVSGYGLNYILENNTTEWNVQLTIYNCHTGKIVVQANIPNETVSYGADEWRESYND